MLTFGLESASAFLWMGRCSGQYGYLIQVTATTSTATEFVAVNLVTNQTTNQPKSHTHTPLIQHARCLLPLPSLKPRCHLNCKIREGADPCSLPVQNDALLPAHTIEGVVSWLANGTAAAGCDTLSAKRMSCAWAANPKICQASLILARMNGLMLIN